MFRKFLKNFAKKKNVKIWFNLTFLKFFEKIQVLKKISVIF